MWLRRARFASRTLPDRHARVLVSLQLSTLDETVIQQAMYYCRTLLHIQGAGFFQPRNYRFTLSSHWLRMSMGVDEQVEVRFHPHQHKYAELGIRSNETRLH